MGSNSILVTGGTGFIGRTLVTHLQQAGFRPIVLTRNRNKARRRLQSVEIIESLDEITDDQPIQAVVNLVGASIAGQFWTDRYKQLMRTSRIDSTERLVEWIASRANKPLVMVSASAIGFYGDRADEDLTEESPPGDDFGARLCRDWEEAAMNVERHGVRLVRLRIGLVLGKGGGILRAMLLPVLFGIGAPMGSGRQWMSWIHISDLVGLIMKAISDKFMIGPFNATAPEPATNETFIRSLGQVWHRPVFLRIPAWPLKKLLGEMSELFLEGQKVIPRRALAAGYQFAHPSLRQALEEIHG